MKDSLATKLFRCAGCVCIMVVLVATEVWSQTSPRVAPPFPVTQNGDFESDSELTKGEYLRLASALDSDDWGENFFDFDSSSEDQPDRHPTLQEVYLPPSLEHVEPWRQDELSPEMTGWIRWIVLRNLPPTYEDKKKWGKQKSIFEGIDFERKGLRIDSHRRYKTVDHGTWSRYFVEFIDPKEQLIIRIVDLKEAKPGTIQFRCIVEAPLHVYGQLKRYQWNARLWSISADADARVQMQVDAEVDIQLNPFMIPPSVTFAPRASAAKVELLEFRVKRISHMKGPMAKFLGMTLREVLENKLEEYDEKLVEKINRQFDKQKDKLHLSADKWFESTISKSVQMP